MMSSRLVHVFLPFLLAAAITDCAGDYHTFADYPGFSDYYRDRCSSPPPKVPDEDRRLLVKFRPRFILPPGGSYPIDFYRDYLPYTRLVSWPGKMTLAAKVNRELLLQHRADRGAYLDFDTDRYRADGMDRKAGKPDDEPMPEPVVYGRVYREDVSFPAGGGGVEKHHLTFLKYNVVFASSGLPADLPALSRFLLWLSRLDPSDWHALDNFVAVHVVLDEEEDPLAVVLAQHNNHRTYLLDADIPLPPGGRTAFDIAVRSNEVYPASDSSEPVRHRVIRWSLYLDYLLSSENGPILKGYDITIGRNAGGREFDYSLVTLSPCDPLYTSEMLLGPPRPFLGMYLGRDGPPGSDYYNVPALLPLGNMLKFSYLKDRDPKDISVVRRAVDRRSREIDTGMIMQHGGRRFLEDWKERDKRNKGEKGKGRRRSTSGK